MMKKILLILVGFVTLTQVINAQSSFPAFAKDIAAFKKQDSTNLVPENAILFVGSSSFAKWKDIADYFPGYNIVNRGFGGSTLVDVIRYAYDIIIPYQPKQVFIYAGDNDLAQGASVADVVTRLKTLFQIIRINIPNATIDYVSIKPSPSRQHLMAKMKEANNQIEAFLKTQKNTGFVNVFAAMLNAEGTPKPEIFVEDRLHLNADGYAIWKKILLVYLKK
jgi:lysophospholipase L1-like esterase